MMTIHPSFWIRFFVRDNAFVLFFLGCKCRFLFGNRQLRSRVKEFRKWIVYTVCLRLQRETNN